MKTKVQKPQQDKGPIAPLPLQEKTYRKVPSSAVPKPPWLKCETTAPTEAATPKKALKPYWNDSCKELSSQWGWLVGTDWENLENAESNKTLEKSWFSAKLIKGPSNNIFDVEKLSSTYAPDKGEDKVIISKLIQVLPTKEQRALFKQWIGTYRFVYNLALAEIQKEPRTPS